MHVLRGLRRPTVERLPELRRRFHAAPDTTGHRMAPGAVGEQAAAFVQTRPPVVRLGRHRRALTPNQEYSAREPLALLHEPAAPAGAAHAAFAGSSRLTIVSEQQLHEQVSASA